MNRNTSFIRKVVYGCCIVALLFPLFILGQPPVEGDDQRSRGGTLAQLREDYGLSQAGLGEIDPASETFKMATLGLRGVATNILWTKANQFKKKENWDQLAATLNQIARLQPNFISVWEFQAHNLSYNVSSEFDNYRHRYHWVKKGIDFLVEGTRYNQRSPRLFWNLGWFTCQKIGRADEHELFRDMFREDFDFHTLMVEAGIDVDDARGPDGLPDNWLVGYEWYTRSASVVDRDVPITWLRLNPDIEGLTDKRRSSVIFYSDPSMALTNHAAAITEETEPDEKTRAAWNRALREWEVFGNMDIPTTFGHTVRLNQLPELGDEITRLRAELDELVPGVRQALRTERIAELTDAEREALTKTPKDFTTPEEYEIAYIAREKVTVDDFDVVAQAPPHLEAAARRLATRIGETEELGARVNQYAAIINFFYWKKRCEIEQTEEAAAARAALRRAEDLMDNQNPAGARVEYELAWRLWEQIFVENPVLIDDVVADDLGDSIMRYSQALRVLDEPFPSDFPLNILLDRDRPLMTIETGEVVSPGQNPMLSGGVREGISSADDQEEPEGDDPDGETPDGEASEEDASTDTGDDESPESDSPGSDSSETGDSGETDTDASDSEAGGTEDGDAGAASSEDEQPAESR